jgi:hypothetical protein
MLTRNTHFYLLLISLLSLIVAMSTFDQTQYDFPGAAAAVLQNAADDSPDDDAINPGIDRSAFFAFCAQPGVNAATRKFVEEKVHTLRSLLSGYTPSFRAPPARS